MHHGVLFGFVLGILAYSFLYIAKGIEKYAIEGIKKVRTLKSRNSIIWIFGVALNAAYMFTQWAALKYAPINIIAPLNGFGLIILLVFCYFVLKESISLIEVYGVSLIAIGTVTISIFNSNTDIVNPENFNLKAYLLFLIITVLCEILLVIFAKFKQLKCTGILVGLTAGTFFALETVSKRITAIPDKNIQLLFSILTMLVATIGFIFTQYALVKEKANIAIPCFASTSVLFATIIGVIFLGEGSNLLSAMGIVLILIGIVLLTAFKKKQTYKKGGFNYGISG